MGDRSAPETDLVTDETDPRLMRVKKCGSVGEVVKTYPQAPDATDVLGNKLDRVKLRFDDAEVVFWLDEVEEVKEA